MKWSIVGLVLLGLCAAIAVSILVAWQRSSKHVESLEVEAFYTAKDIPELTVVAADMVTTRKTPRSQLPSDAIIRPSNVIGQVVRMPMPEGKLFVASCLVTKDFPVNLAEALPNGMRAITLSLSDYGALEGLLSPGSTVDVLASFRVPGAQNEIASLTLLRGVQVLAINGQTITANDNSPGQVDRITGSKRLITVKVTAKQAELLQLAQENADISLALRNPLDVTTTDDSATLLSQVSSILARRYASGEARSNQVPLPGAKAGNGATWQTVFLRGGVSETVYLPMPSTQSRSR